MLTLLTDFSSHDVYVGVMKGVIACINPRATIVDLTHEIPPQDVAAARFCLMNAYPYFPQGTVHVAVVDPGVGSARRAIALQLPHSILVGPDNGLFSGVLSPENPILAAVELSNSDYWRTPDPSTTFHGRDIFAPVGAHLSKGVPLEDLGPAIDPQTLVTLDLPQWQWQNQEIAGFIQYIDRFGNLITNIPGSVVRKKLGSVAVGDRMIPGGNTYSDAPKGGSVALVGSHGWVEIAINGGNASYTLQLAVGGTVRVRLS
ncbi:SAM hydrolase/SAM-dependent halogenase family protein [Laspinema olomoucense]|uniref:SAM hydrolase/SAM-dependent halogenase family protein n=1 Tax=Laspinema olomoucense TaxID=3231600 RepID=UPI0021BB0EF2|nr:SAM-dependent chlorinase/fluorinase [Laspinema sp. D3d]MCT7974125.1 SAM-dependent chlorinase/fluorinase [Laspinema sp. D3d]